MEEFDFLATTPQSFDEQTLAVFQHQAKNCKVYRDFIGYLNINPKKITSPKEIPFLPIQFFKSHQIISGSESIQETFLSSGTTGTSQSKHFVTNISLYEKSYLNAFEQFYGDITEYTILALLPSYLERKGSSLIYMVEDIINKSENPNSGFYLHNHKELFDKLQEQEKQQKKTLLIGVSFALLDFIEKYPCELQHTVVMETGGMKGKRKEMIREELHEELKKGFGVQKIHSEYGMTELLSQAYFDESQKFNCPPWMKILIRDTEDALSLLPNEKSGGINVIDLANYNSCSFIATQDLGKVYNDGTFDVLGRFDNSDIRGCNLLIQ
ncbi:phenylacetate-coenzyme A ligase PaaK-like adenylate-forming protein [Wenyingzhuangia heitensis]|uniref:Phenylacetate-coenzyme A ligase PaaK-like adenylate-forming protein n=1 Tax=Wenyingzhuangia heitensis TaxID=1487859 RepID=A0ABX0U725_9FLAO|nr:acyl transferase [Wenyingzhuangia heitensis]NIJ43983.1 phenylacetate-coenzyme A ligase PaaK-like adenylate-forming protein [Wenyingzhuangia heitensis]